MVDFQSRDTRRGPTTDDEAEEASDTESDEEEPAAQPADDDQSTAEAGGEQATEPSEERDAATETDSGDPATSDPLADTTTETDSGDPATSDPLADTGSEPPAADTDETAAEPERVTPSRSVAVAIVTVSGAGEGVEERVAAGFEAAGHTVTVRERLRGNYDTVQQVVDRLVDRKDVDVVVTAGGVGIGSDEVTIEAVHPLLEKALPGFGEAFRTLLFDVIGTGIVAVRSAAGVADGSLVFCLPGDPEAAQVAVEEILVTEAPELVDHLDG